MGRISVSALRPWFLHRTALAAFYPPKQVKTYFNCNKVLCTWKPYNTLLNPYSLKPFTLKTLTLKPLKSHFKSHTLNFKSHCLNPGGPQNCTYWMSPLYSSHKIISEVLHDLNTVCQISETPTIWIFGFPQGAGLRQCSKSFHLNPKFSKTYILSFETLLFTF